MNRGPSDCYRVKPINLVIISQINTSRLRENELSDVAFTIYFEGMGGTC